MKIHEERIISGDIDSAWELATNVNEWSSWDPHEEWSKIEGDFQVGTRGESKPRGGPAAKWVLTKVDPKKSWALLNKMPIGSLDVENRYEQLPDGKVRLEKRMIVSGFLVFLFWIYFEKATRHDMQSTWIEMEKQIAKRGDQLH